MNHKYFNDQVSIIYEWIPQVLFMSCIFVYLCFTIVYKWIAWDSLQSGDAPSLLINLIGMFMLKVPNKNDHTWIFGTPNEETGAAAGQNVVQKIFIFIAILCIPVMLFGKPYIKYKAAKDRRNAGSTHFGGVRVQMSGTDDTTNILEDDELQNEHEAGPSGAAVQNSTEEEFNLTEAMVEQMIHTIEYALGCISHTASYLRLWALSLAHAELSDVLWTMVLRIGLVSSSSAGHTGSVMSFLVFWAFSALSVAILIGMEGLSAFLHALRLHWVEFNSKFYKGEGIEFEPFNFKPILEAGDNNEE